MNDIWPAFGKTFWKVVQARATKSTRPQLEVGIADNMRRFVNVASTDTTLAPKVLGLGNITLAELLGRLVQTYELDMGKDPEPGEHS